MGLRLMFTEWRVSTLEFACNGPKIIKHSFANASYCISMLNYIAALLDTQTVGPARRAGRDMATTNSLWHARLSYT